MTDATGVLVERLAGLTPTVALVLGSGLGGLVEEIEDAVQIPYGDIPGFPKGGVSGHAGKVVAGLFNGTPVLMLAGRAHYYEHGNPAAMRPAVKRASKVARTTARSSALAFRTLSTASSIESTMKPDTP